MAIIYSYPKITSLDTNDRFIISKMDQDNNPTKSLSFGDLVNQILPLVPPSPPPAGTVSGTGTTNYIMKWTDGPNSIAGDSNLFNSTTHIQSEVDFVLKPDGAGPSAGSVNLDFNGIDDLGAEIVGARIFTTDSTINPSGQDLYIQNASDAGTLGTNIFVDAFGFVGLGTTSPLANLHVANDLRVGTNLVVNSNVKFSDYGSGTKTGTSTYNLAVDANGNVIEEASSGGGGVTSIIAGANVSISPVGGTGDVTINASGGSGSGVPWPNEYSLAQTRLLQGENPATLDPATNAVTTLGVGAGASLTTGNVNTLIGTEAGNSLTSGNAHTAVGYRALASENFTGGGCVAIGYDALRQQNGIGITIFNTAVGATAGNTVTTGNTNVLIGYSAGNSGGVGLSTGSGNIIIGTFAAPSSNTVSDEITLGNSNAAVLRCQQTSITALSDERDKTDIEDLPYGLDFVDSLQPKKFTWDHRPETDIDGNERFSSNKGKKDIGFIAQELQTVDDDWLNLVYDSNPDKLEATYGKLIPVLVKAIKELKTRVEALEN